MLINYQHKISLSVPLLNEFYLTKLIMTQNYQISVWNRNQIGVITTMSNVLKTDAHLGFEAFTVNHFWLGLWSHGLWWKNLCSTWHKESTTYSLVIKICSLEILHGVTEHRRNNHVIILNSLSRAWKEWLSWLEWNTGENDFKQRWPSLPIKNKSGRRTNNGKKMSMRVSGRVKGMGRSTGLASVSLYCFI